MSNNWLRFGLLFFIMLLLNFVALAVLNNPFYFAKILAFSIVSLPLLLVICFFPKIKPVIVFKKSAWSITAASFIAVVYVLGLLSAILGSLAWLPIHPLSIGLCYVLLLTLLLAYLWFDLKAILSNPSIKRDALKRAPYVKR